MLDAAQIIKKLESATSLELAEFVDIVVQIKPKDFVDILPTIVKFAKNFKLIDPSRVMQEPDSEYAKQFVRLYNLISNFDDAIQDDENIREATEEELEFFVQLYSPIDAQACRSLFIANLDKDFRALFRQADVSNGHSSEYPFFSVLGLDPKFFKVKFAALSFKQRSFLAKQAFLRIPIYHKEREGGDYYHSKLGDICTILECFAPHERAQILHELPPALLFYSLPIRDDRMLSIMERFAGLMTQSIPYYQTGIGSLISSFPEPFRVNFLSYANHPEYLAAFNALKDELYDQLMINGLVACICQDLNQQQFGNLHGVLIKVSRSNHPLYVQICNAIMANSIAFAQVSKYDLLEFQPNGMVLSRSARFALGYRPENLKLKPTIKSTQILRPSAPARCSIEELTEEWQFVRSLNRTLIFAHKNYPDRMRAIKLRKKDEDISALFKEQHALELLRDRKEAYDLQSPLPNPIGVFLISGLPTDLIPTTVAEPEDGLYYGYVYDTKPGYFKYIVDPSLTTEQFSLALRIAVHDLITLLVRDGFAMHQLIDLFHNDDKARSDGGIYNPILGLEGGSTTGKLMAWMEGCKYPNLREGLADFGDYTLINKPEDFCLYLGRYLLSFELIIAYRAREKYDTATTEDGKREIWRQAARTIIGVYDLVLAELRLNYQSVNANIIADFERLARQLQYWLTTEYIKDVAKDKVEPGIHDDAGTVSAQCTNKLVIAEGLSNWNSLVGYTSFRNPDKSKQDIGPFAGPFTVTELTKLRDSFVFFVSNNLGTINQVDACKEHEFKCMLASSRLLLKR